MSNVCLRVCAIVCGRVRTYQFRHSGLGTHDANTGWGFHSHDLLLRESETEEARENGRDREREQARESAKERGRERNKRVCVLAYVCMCMFMCVRARVCMGVHACVCERMCRVCARGV